jgi:hypothetical protein
LPGLIYAFPFLMFEQVITGNHALERAYANARATFLEDTIASLIATGLPSAKVDRAVMWRDNDSQREYENDVVAIVGNTIFLFEAKSGRLDDVARRGGGKSLVTNFRELFVEPGEQARRLENHLNNQRDRAILWVKKTGARIALDLQRPKIVHKFSICIEHFASLTSAKHHLKELGLIPDDSAWAPVLSIGEFQLVWRYLDTEISLFHYLTRRATLEEVMNFRGDEQDILSVYLINGLWIETEEIKGRTVLFKDSCGIVRRPKEPRKDRRECELYGVLLSAYWKALICEIYSDVSNRHRFDIIEVLLNQSPPSLAATEGKIRKWKKSLSRKRANEEVVFSYSTIGARTFVLAFAFVDRAIGESEWVQRARRIAYEGALPLFSASDCAVIGKSKKSKEWTYDAITFFRFGHRSTAQPADGA